jgi:hypothetical protein
VTEAECLAAAAGAGLIGSALCVFRSSVAADIRLFSFGYSASLERRKQYVQSMLHVDPLGLVSR